MRIGTSAADRAGFVVFLALAALLAVLLVTSLGDGSDESAADESATEIMTFADLPEVTPVPTTAPVELPEPTPTPEPIEIATSTPEPETAEAAETEGDESDPDADTTTDDAVDSASTGSDTSSAAADSGGSGQTAAAPNPQPQATEVPNPQPQATEAPNPQPQQVVAPAPAPVGGTFTHTLTATVARPTLYTSAGGSAFVPTFNGLSLPAVNPTVFGNPLVYRVLAGAPGDAWAQVLVPARPNGTTAWVQTSQFQWGSSNRKIVINISTNTVTVYEGDSVLLNTQAVTGKSSSRTPLANGWVEEIMPGPSGAYGPLLISLGIFSNDLNSFGGGVPKIALHGTNNPSLMGQYASNGCIRVRNDVITQIAGLVTPGSRVEIVG